MHTEFFIVAEGADREDIYNLCWNLRLCYKNRIVSITVM